MLYISSKNYVRAYNCLEHILTRAYPYYIDYKTHTSNIRSNGFPIRSGNKAPKQAITKRREAKQEEKLEIDGFTIIAMECESDSDDSYLPDNKESTKNTHGGYVRQNRAHRFVDAHKYPINKYNGKEYANYEKGAEYPALCSYSQEDASTSIVKTGPFEIVRAPETLAKENNTAMKIEEKESAQLNAIPMASVARFENLNSRNSSLNNLNNEFVQV